MGIQEVITHKDITIGLWVIDKKPQEITDQKQNLTQGKEVFSSNKKRIQEQLATQLLLKKMRPKACLSYNSFGAPKINTQEYISISHTNEKVAIIISKNKVGIDIEKVSNRILKLTDKFTDKKIYQNLCVNKAILIWSAKEAIYKWYEKGRLNFRKDIIIEDFNIDEKGLLIANFRDQKLTLTYKKINNHYLVYICN